MRIAILYIATGRYSIFWKDFFQSSEKYFIPAAEKHYYVFTDAENLYGIHEERVHPISHHKLGWPEDTLMRFDIFLKVKDELIKADYIFFFNANMKFVQPVSAEEFMPGEESDGLLVVQHPGQYTFTPDKYTYDRNERSLAYVAPGMEGKYYVMGGLNGGRSDQYIALINAMDRNIKEDLAHQVIAIWHDESHLNKYILDKHPRLLTPSYGYPEGRKLPYIPKIIIQDKRKYGGHNYLRRFGKITAWQWITSRFVIVAYYIVAFTKQLAR